MPGSGKWGGLQGIADITTTKFMSGAHLGIGGKCFIGGQNSLCFGKGHGGFSGGNPCLFLGFCQDGEYRLAMKFHFFIEQNGIATKHRANIGMAGNIADGNDVDNPGRLFYGAEIQ